MTTKTEQALTSKDEAIAAIKYIVEHCLNGLSEVKEMSPDDIALINHTIKTLGNDFAIYVKFMDYIGIKNEHAEAICQTIARISLGAFILGLSQRIPADLNKYHHAQSSSLGGHRGKKTKEARAAATWGDEARRRIVAIAARGISSKRSLAARLMEKWPDDSNALPSEKVITRLIDEMLRNGEISLDK